MAGPALSVVHLRWACRAGGVLVSGLFALYGVYLFFNLDTGDFWKGCHSLSQGILALGLGTGGCYFEVQGAMPAASRRFMHFFINRTGLAVFYFWIGCYVMGGRVLSGSKTVQVFGHTTGFIAWAVALGDLVVACCFDHGSSEEESLKARAAPPGRRAPGSTSKSLRDSTQSSREDEDDEEFDRRVREERAVASSNGIGIDHVFMK